MYVCVSLLLGLLIIIITLVLHRFRNALASPEFALIHKNIGYYTSSHQEFFFFSGMADQYQFDFIVLQQNGTSFCFYTNFNIKIFSVFICIYWGFG